MYTAWTDSSARATDAGSRMSPSDDLASGVREVLNTLRITRQTTDGPPVREQLPREVPSDEARGADDEDRAGDLGHDPS